MGRSSESIRGVQAGGWGVGQGMACGSQGSIDDRSMKPACAVRDLRETRGGSTVWLWTFGRCFPELQSRLMTALVALESLGAKENIVSQESKTRYKLTSCSGLTLV